MTLSVDDISLFLSQWDSQLQQLEDVDKNATGDLHRSSPRRVSSAWDLSTRSPASEAASRLSEWALFESEPGWAWGSGFLDETVASNEQSMSLSAAFPSLTINPASPRRRGLAGRAASGSFETGSPCLSFSSPQRRKSKNLDGVDFGSPARRRKLSGYQPPSSLCTPTRKLSLDDDFGLPTLPTPQGRKMPEPEQYRTPTNTRGAPCGTRGALLMSTPELRERSLVTPPRPEVSAKKAHQEIDLALQQGSHSLLALAVRAGHDMTCCCECSVAHAVVYRRRSDALAFLLKQKRDASTCDLGVSCASCGRRPLDLAVACSVSQDDAGYEMTRQLLLHGEKPDHPRNGGGRWVAGAVEAPLREAARRGHSAMVALLLAHGADPSAVDYAGRTALHVVCPFGTILLGDVKATVLTLLRYHANPCQLDAAGRSPRSAIEDSEARGILALAERHYQRGTVILAAGRRIGASTSSACDLCFSIPDIFEAILRWL
eukprot:TRINITY_DN90742_c0_g1_i1.p1 TRINITY_DN90742_c0_g1~~TRINITY_DN90742_c0_g1_i1.p1  ORF type:complete len:488 (-),score=16.19 TRINITY_DN90742_c0_g1_i1:304-1767(-)